MIMRWAGRALVVLVVGVAAVEFMPPLGGLVLALLLVLPAAVVLAPEPNQGEMTR